VQVTALDRTDVIHRLARRGLSRAVETATPTASGVTGPDSTLEIVLAVLLVRGHSLNSDVAPVAGRTASCASSETCTTRTVEGPR